MNRSRAWSFVAVAVSLLACSGEVSGPTAEDTGAPPDGRAAEDDASSTGSRDGASTLVDVSPGTACGLPAEVPTDSGVCNALAPTGPLVTEACSSGSVPAPQGGTIQDGTYLLESVTYYGPCPATLTQDRVVWVICGNRWDSAQVIGSATTTYDVSVSAGDASSALSVDVMCPLPGASFAYSYDATPGHLSLHFLVPGQPAGQPVTTEVDSYTRQE
jgi:hypothetical protein